MEPERRLALRVKGAPQLPPVARGVVVQVVRAVVLRAVVAAAATRIRPRPDPKS